LVVKIVDANVKGEPLPKAFLEGLSEENLAKEVSKNPDLSKSLEPFEKIEIIDNAIHLQLKPIDEPKDEPVTAEAPPMPIDVPAEQQPLLTP
jgi:hypothetical protein